VKKKIFSIVLLLVMVLSMAMPVAAEEETTAWTAADFTYGEISQEMYPANNQSDVTKYSGIGITGFSESGEAKVATNPKVVLPAEDTAGNKVVGVAANALKSKNIEELTLPESAHDWIIGASAFQKNKLTSVDLSGVVYVGGNAFNGNQLTSVTFNEDIWWIANAAFGKNALTTVNFPEKTTHDLNLDNMAFAINSLTSVKLPSNVEKLHKWVFMQNTGLEEITSGTSAEKKGGVVYMLTGDIDMLSTTSGFIGHAGAGSSVVQKFIYNGAVGEAEGRVFDTGAKALAAVEAGTGVILDVRANERRADLQLSGSLHQPLFTVNAEGKNQVTSLADTLAIDFLAFTKDNADLANKTVYILCNSGASGAEAATRLLLSNGYPMSQIVSITNGAKDLDIVRKSVVRENALDPAIAIDVVNNPANHPDEVIIDVRAVERYDVGHLKGSTHLPLFTVDATTDKNVPTTLEDDLANKFTAYVKDNAEKLNGKKIYVLCNSGQTGAKNAAKLLYLAGYNLDNVFTITGGASSDTMKAELRFVSDDQTLRVLKDENYVIIDVRATEKYDAGHFENSVHLPLFTYDAVNDKNVPVQAPYEDELSQAFLSYVNEHKDELSAKKVYILCNSGQTGAKNAMALFDIAGFDPANVFAIVFGCCFALSSTFLRFLRVFSVFTF